MLISLVSSGIVYLFGGPFADKLTLKISRMRRKTSREPEFQLPNLIVPFLASMVGCIMFGCAVQFHWHIAITLLGNTLLMTGSLTAATILKTFIIECYPQWPGPVLVNVNTLRTMISFGFSSRASTWVQERGYLFVFGVYVAVLFILSTFLPVFYFYGKKFRLWTSGRVGKSDGYAYAAPPTPPSGFGPKPDDSSAGSSTALSSGLSRTETNSRPGLPRSTTIGSIDRTLSRVMTVETVEVGTTGTPSTDASKSKTNVTSVTIKEDV